MFSDRTGWWSLSSGSLIRNFGFGRQAPVAMGLGILKRADEIRPQDDSFVNRDAQYEKVRE